jgi:hypothetical protein
MERKSSMIEAKTLDSSSEPSKRQRWGGSGMAMVLASDHDQPDL